MNSLANSSWLKGDLETGNISPVYYDLLLNFQERMWGSSHHVFVADTEGHIILSPHHGDNKKSTHFHHSIADSKYFKASLEETQVTDFFGFEESTHYHQLVMVPVKHNGRTLGVSISEITTQYLIDLMKQDFELGETGQIYLSTLDFKKVVHLKKDGIKNIKSPLIEKAFQQGSVYGENQGPTHESAVLASYIKSEKFPWLLAVEISKEEVIAPIVKLTRYIFVAYVFFIGLFLAVFKQIIKMLKKPVQDISHVINNISEDAAKNSVAMIQSTTTLVEGSEKLFRGLN